MQIFLLRTSLTADDSPSATEANRHLTFEGRQLVRQVGNKLRSTEESNFDRILCAPTPAAVQSAELFADRVDYVGVVEVLSSLTAGVPPQVVAPVVLARGESVAVVADEPVISSLGAFLIGRTTFPPLEHAQVSVIRHRQPAWFLRPGDIGPAPLLVASANA